MLRRWLLAVRSNGTDVSQLTPTNGVTEWGARWQRASSR